MPESRIPAVYAPASWRNTLPVSDDGAIGVGFNVAHGIIRLKLDVTSARHRMETISQALHATRSQSSTDGGTPSDDAFKPRGNENV